MCGVFPQKHGHAAEDIGGNDSKITIGYWNDNFFSKRIPGLKTSRTRDDFQTASFWLHAAAGQSCGWRHCDSFFTILTHKQKNFRTDLIAIRFSKEHPFFRGPLRVGFGLAANGDFGGSSIQNGYHGIFGNKKVDLPYSVASHIGGTASLRLAPVILETGHFKLNGYASSYLRTAVIPCNTRAGLEFDAVKAFGNRRFHCQIIGGYTGYFGGMGPLVSLFENGFTWGMLVSGGLSGRLGTSVWYANNQYGLKQYQFGCSVTFAGKGPTTGDLNDVTFP